MTDLAHKPFLKKVALISGGASGIGLATAKRLIAGGATVWITDIQDTLGERIAEEIGATYVHLDVVNEAEWISVIELIASQGQGLHYVMNNAGIASSGNLETETVEGFMQTIKINPDRQARPAQNMRCWMMLTAMPCMNNVRDNKVA